LLYNESRRANTGMIFSLLIALIAMALLFGVFVVALALRKRFRSRNLQLIGESARVETSLAPNGSVIVNGELWPAQSTNGDVIPAQSRVRIVAVQDLYLLVETCH
jgi:membrane-bound ClpP family serine protease